MLKVLYVQCGRCCGECTIFTPQGRKQCPHCVGNGQVVICDDPVVQAWKTEALTKMNTWDEIKKSPQEWAYEHKSDMYLKVSQPKKDTN
jgi:hypothetical protein